MTDDTPHSGETLSAEQMERLIDAGLNARVPGGAEVTAWLPQKDAWTPHQTARDVMEAAIKAVLAARAEGRAEPLSDVSAKAEKTNTSAGPVNAARQDQGGKTSGGTMGPLPMEDIRAYLDGWLGKNELRVGPNMLAWALKSLLSKYDATASPPGGEQEAEAEAAIWREHDARSSRACQMDNPTPGDGGTTPDPEWVLDTVARAYGLLWASVQDNRTRSGANAQAARRVLRSLLTPEGQRGAIAMLSDDERLGPADMPGDF